MKKKIKQIVKDDKKKREALFDKLAPLLGKYLNACGWSCVLIGEKGIGSEDGKYKNNLIFSFLGAKKEDKEVSAPSPKQ